MGFRILLHSFNFFISQARRRFNINFLFLACPQIFCRNMDNAISVNIKSNLNLWYSTRSRWDIGQFKPPQCLIVGSHRPFPLEHMNIYRRLIVAGSRKYLALGCRDRCISFNHSRKYTAECFNTKRQWCYVEKENIFDLSF